MTAGQKKRSNAADVSNARGKYRYTGRIWEHNEYANSRTSLVSSVLIKPTARETRDVHTDINSSRNMNKLLAFTHAIHENLLNTIWRRISSRETHTRGGGGVARAINM